MLADIFQPLSHAVRDRVRRLLGATTRRPRKLRIGVDIRPFYEPLTGVGWAALAGISVATPIALLAVFTSANRVGPFRTALVMNLEPLLSSVGSAIALGDVITPLQALGGAIMLAALVAFQLRR